MMTKLFQKLFLPAVLSALSIFSFAQNSYLVPVGGGKIADEDFKTILSLSSHKNPSVLIIPYASKLADVPKTLEKNKAMLENVGVKNISFLDVNDPQNGAKLIEKADVIWIPGGIQVRLRKALENVNLIQEIKKRYDKGNIVISGTSAGASIMTDVMMASSKKDPLTGELNPIIDYGFKLWKDAIIDQHFTQRKRFIRLEKAIREYPNLLGIGLDEGTAIIYNDTKTIKVLGRGTVTFIKTEKNGEQKITVLKANEVYSN